MSTIEFIDTPEALHDFCQAIKHAPWLAIDTEFLREKTYYPQFCLLQIGTTEQVACIDPIALAGQLDEVFAIINDPNIIKVLHSCRQDVEIFYHLSGKIPAPIYDTQVVAPLLGYQINTGYAMLVSGMLNVSLSKVQTRTDWSQRPLSQAQIQYAADDVIYLGKIYQIMQQQLSALGRERWLDGDFERLLDPNLYNIPNKDAWLRIKGKHKLTGKQLAIVYRLAEWREEVAKKSDLPKNWIVRDEVIMDMARLQPSNVRELSGIRHISDGFLRRHGETACAMIKKGIASTELNLKAQVAKTKKTAQQDAIADVLTAVVRLRAEASSLNPTILASRKDLESLIFNEPDCLLKSGWRYEMIGSELEQILNNEKQLSVCAGELALV